MKYLKNIKYRKSLNCLLAGKKTSLVIFMILVCLSAKANTDNNIDERWSDILRQGECGTWSSGVEEKRRRLGGDILEMNGEAIPIRMPKGEIVTETQLEVIKDVIKNDFLVNDDTTFGYYQYTPSVAIDGSGSFVICWQDGRNSSRDIYMQIYDAGGTPQGSNFRVNDDAGTSEKWYPSVAMDGSGGFIICWEDGRNGDWDIYAQMYNVSGALQGPNFRVNDNTGSSSQWCPSVAMNGSSNFVICWQDGRNGDKDIYAQMYDANGTPQEFNFRVDDDTGSSYQRWPSVTMDGSGNFVICWYDQRNDDYDIYAQMYDAGGSPQGFNFRVDDDIWASDQYNPSVAMYESGTFLICWMDERNDWDNPDIYAQVYDASGTPQGSNFRVDDDTGSSDQRWPSVAMDGSGSFVICWYDRRNDDYDIYAQVYDASGTPQGSNFMVNDDTGSSSQWYPSVAMDGSSSFVICWQDKRNGNRDIYTQRYDAGGTPQGSNFMVNDDTGSSSQWYPSVAMDGSGSFVICWEDVRYGNNDIYAQMYDASGTPQVSNFRVNDDTWMYRGYPSIAIDSSGNFLICWQDLRNSWDYPDPDIYAQMYDAGGTPQGSNFRVNDDGGECRQKYPSVAMDGSGSFVICWYDRRSNEKDIYAQMYNASGTPQGSNFRVNDDVVSRDQWYPSVAMDGSGSFVICWEDKRNDNWDIYAQRYDTNGAPLDSNFRVNDDTGVSEQGYPSIAMDGSGSSLICWEDERNGDNDIYAQRYNASGTPQGSNFRVNDDTGVSEQGYPSIAMDPSGSRFVIVWTDFRNPDGDPEIVAQKYVNGSPVGNNVQINEPDLFPYNHQLSGKYSVDCNNDIVVFTWMDNRRHKGWDIYGKLTDWELVGIEEDMIPQISDLKLRVYPNPFRSCITICGGDSELEIYDICGRLITKTENNSWNGTNQKGNEVQSGIYFIKAKGYEPMKVVKTK